jgi:hypothetical protein
MVGGERFFELRVIESIENVSAGEACSTVFTYSLTVDH